MHLCKIIVVKSFTTQAPRGLSTFNLVKLIIVVKNCIAKSPRGLSTCGLVHLITVVKIFTEQAHSCLKRFSVRFCDETGQTTFFSSNGQVFSFPTKFSSTHNDKTSQENTDRHIEMVTLMVE